MNFGDDVVAEKNYRWVCLMHGTIGFVDGSLNGKVRATVISSNWLRQNLLEG